MKTNATQIAALPYTGPGDLSYDVTDYEFHAWCGVDIYRVAKAFHFLAKKACKMKYQPFANVNAYVAVLYRGNIAVMHRGLFEKFKEILEPSSGYSILLSPCFLGPGMGKKSAESVLQSDMAAEIHRIAEARGWPPVEKVTREYKLGKRGYVDLLVDHTDGSTTMVEVKHRPNGMRVGVDTMPIYAAIGQLLQYSVKYKHESERPVRLCIAGNGEPGECWSPVTEMMNVPIEYVNLDPFTGHTWVESEVARVEKEMGV